MSDKDFEAMSLFEQMAEIDRMAKEILEPLAEESREDGYRMAHPTRKLSDGRIKDGETGYVYDEEYERISDYTGDTSW